MDEPRDDLLQLGRAATVHPSLVRWQFARGSGPGGQNVNKVNTRAELWVKVTDITGLTPAAVSRLRQFAGKKLTIEDEIHIVAGESRSQEMNRQAAINRLRELVSKAAVEPKIRRKTKPSRGSKMRRLESKKRRSEVKDLRRRSMD